MPFRSKLQAKYLFSQHPDIAKRWVSEGYTTKGLPNKVKSSKQPSKRHGIRNLKSKKYPKKV